LRLELESELVTRYITPEGAPDLPALAADLESTGAPPTHLVNEIRAGRLSRADAESWLRDYALALDIRDPSIRASLLNRRAPLIDHDRAAAELLTALRSRAAATASLSREALSSNQSIADYASPRAAAPPTRETAIELWRLLILETIDDPEKREAARRAFEALFPPAATIASAQE
ncbi:MAG: hypothetical protein VYC34_06705, partial [Planctomycetota bacterium]|nr:hypothetical protein [Planctomycetota bacterium]